VFIFELWNPDPSMLLPSTSSVQAVQASRDEIFILGEIG